METRSQSSNLAGAVEKIQKSEEELERLYDEIKSCAGEGIPQEREILSLRKRLREVWRRYVACNEQLIALTDEGQIDEVRGTHFKRCEQKGEYDEMLERYLTSWELQHPNIHSSAVPDDQRSYRSASRASQLTSGSANSSKARAKRAERQIAEANLEIELAQAELAVKQAKLAASKKIGFAEEELMLIEEEPEADIRSVSRPGHDAGERPGHSEIAVGDGDKTRDELTAKGWARTSPFEVTAMNETLLAVQRLGMAHELPTPEVMKFSGNPIEYPRFKNRFTELVDSKPMDECQKMTRLMQFLSGPAKKAVEGCELAGKGRLKRALKILQDRYGQPYVIVTACLKSITEGEQLKTGDRIGFREFSDDVRSVYDILISMDSIHEVNSANMVDIVKRTPVYFHNKWRSVVHKIRTDLCRSPTLADLVTQLEKEASSLNDPVFGCLVSKNEKAQKVETKPKHFAAREVKVSTMTTSATPTKANSACADCGESHYIKSCPKFKEKNYEARISLVREKRLCFRCLKSGHPANRCFTKSSCAKEGCDRWHDILIHPPENKTGSSDAPPPREKSVNSSPDTADVVAAQVNCHQATALQTGAGNGGSAKSNALMQIVPVIICGENDKKVRTYALLDSASEVTLCDKRLLRQLNVTGEDQHLAISTVNEQQRQTKATRVSLSASRLDSDEGQQHTVSLETVWALDNLNVPVKTPCTADLSRWSHLEGLRFPQVDIDDVMLLIGADHPEALVAIDFRRGMKGEPWAVETKLGWSLMGPTSGNDRQDFGVHFSKANDPLHLLVEQFWAIDSHGIKGVTKSEQTMSVEDKKALAAMDSSAKKLHGHYQIGLPWKREGTALPDNSPMAKQRMIGLKRRLERDAGLHLKYRTVMEGYLEKGHARRVDDNELEETENKRVWYLPHHPVISEHKGGKVRVVFDAAAKFKGVSLNESLLQGPDQTSKLVGVLTRFRFGEVAIVSDVEAMFHQVRVDPKDCNALRFFWWPSEDLSQEPAVYQMLVHIFGATSSPSCASYALKRTADDNKGEFTEEAVNAVHRNFYVDDCLKAVHSEEEAISLVKELRNLLSLGGFRLTKWMSNKKNVVSTIPENDRAPSVMSLDLDGLPIERALGVQWDVEEDAFGYKGIKTDKPATKRGVLSVVSSLYDPLGFVAPFTFKAKVLLQELWRQKVDWDQEIGEAQAKIWQKWMEELPTLRGVKIPRNVLPDRPERLKSMQIHCFADASEDGYGAVACSVHVIYLVLS